MIFAAEELFNSIGYVKNQVMNLKLEKLANNLYILMLHTVVVFQPMLLDLYCPQLDMMDLILSIFIYNYNINIYIL